MARIHIVYFGVDDSDHRAAVLRAAGYEVDERSSLPELADCLKANRDADLVCIADTWDKPAEGALAVARGLSRAPIVLFCSAGHHYSHCSWDLEVENLTSPREWLADIAELLAEARAGSRRPQIETKRWREEQLTEMHCEDGSQGDGSSA